MHHLWSNGDYEISTDPARVDAGMVHEFLTNSYWAKGILLQTVRRSIEHSIPFGVYHGQQQVGFARIISDLSTFAYLADLFHCAALSWPRTFSMANGVYCRSSGLAGTTAAAAGHAGRSWVVRQIWVYCHQEPGPVDGDSPAGFV
jgi:hypothetical protein